MARLAKATHAPTHLDHGHGLRLLQRAKRRVNYGTVQVYRYGMCAPVRVFVVCAVVFTGRGVDVVGGEFVCGHYYAPTCSWHYCNMCGRFTENTVLDLMPGRSGRAGLYSVFVFLRNIISF